MRGHEAASCILGRDNRQDHIIHCFWPEVDVVEPLELARLPGNPHQRSPHKINNKTSKPNRDSHLPIHRIIMPRNTESLVFLTPNLHHGTGRCPRGDTQHPVKTTGSLHVHSPIPL